MHAISPEDSLYLSLAIVAALIASVWDVKTRRIPNWLTLSSIVAGLAAHCVLGGLRDTLIALAAAVVGGGIFAIFFVAGGMGGGDVKLMAAVAAIVGFHSLFQVMVSTAIMGGVFALCLALAHGRLRQTVHNIRLLFLHHRYQGLTPHPEINVSNRKTLRLPYAIAIAAGCLITFIGDLPLR
jgi:prepilin peptidase CpaA